MTPTSDKKSRFYKILNIDLTQKGLGILAPGSVATRIDKFQYFFALVTHEVIGLYIADS